MRFHFSERALPERRLCLRTEPQLIEGVVPLPSLQSEAQGIPGRILLRMTSVDPWVLDAFDRFGIVVEYRSRFCV